MKSNNKENYLFSKITIQGKAHSSLEDIKLLLLDHPGLSLMYSKDILRYSINESGFKQHYFILEISKTNISIITYSMQSPILFLKEAILRLLLILSFIKSSYSIELSELYPFILNILSKEAFEVDELNNQNRYKNTYNEDIILSKRIIQLLRENKELKNEISISKSTILRLVTMNLQLKYSGRINLKIASKDLGIEEELLLNILEKAKSLGYAIIWNNKHEFTMVKT